MARRGSESGVLRESGQEVLKCHLQELRQSDQDKVAKLEFLEEKRNALDCRY